MQLELALSNDPRALPSVAAFVRETLRQLPLSASDAEQLAMLVESAVRDGVEHAYPAGDEGSIQLAIRESRGRLEFLVRDFGLPQDVERLESRLHPEGKIAANVLGVPAQGLVDELHWLGFGPQGKALQIVKWLDGAKITDTSDAAALEPFHENVPLAPPQEYTVGRLQPDEAVQVSQLMYRAYGNTYFNPDVYYPQRVAALNAHDAILSFVARGEDGTIAGHYALELNQVGPVAETGEAVVDPAHRGRGLLDRMKEAALTEARQRGLVGWYGDAVAVHMLTQKSNVTHGGHLSCINLGISPKTEIFRGISGVQPQRVTCLLYFHWLQAAAARTIFAPERQQAIIAEIYQNLECPVAFGTAAEPTGHGLFSVKMNPAARRPTIRVEQGGADSVAAIRHAKRELVERSRAEVVFLELPLADPATPYLAEQLEGAGFAFAGVAPHFAQASDLLRMVYLVEPLERAPIKTFEAFADRLVNYTLAEQARVRGAM